MLVNYLSAFWPPTSCVSAFTDRQRSPIFKSVTTDNRCVSCDGIVTHCIASWTVLHKCTKWLYPTLLKTNTPEQLYKKITSSKSSSITTVNEVTYLQSNLSGYQYFAGHFCFSSTRSDAVGGSTPRIIIIQRDTFGVFLTQSS